MKTLNIATVAALTLFQLGVFAQNAPLIPLPPISLSQYNQMVQEGTQFIAVTPAAIAAQNQQAQAANAQNQAIVKAYMNEFPNSGLAPLVTPPYDPALAPTGDDYTIQVTNAADETQTIELLGQDSILVDLATSIQAASDPAQQAALYQTLYNQYAALYEKVCANSPVAASSISGTACANLPSPSAVTSPVAPSRMLL